MLLVHVVAVIFSPIVLLLLGIILGLKEGPGHLLASSLAPRSQNAPSFPSGIIRYREDPENEVLLHRRQAQETKSPMRGQRHAASKAEEPGRQATQLNLAHFIVVLFKISLKITSSFSRFHFFKKITALPFPANSTGEVVRIRHQMNEKG